MKNYLKIYRENVFLHVPNFIPDCDDYILLSNETIPGSPYANEEQLTQAQLEIMNAKYALDKPVFVQHLIYITFSIIPV